MSAFAIVMMLIAAWLFWNTINGRIPAIVTGQTTINLAGTKASVTA